MLTVVNSSELFNGTTDSSSFLLNKIDVQVEVETLITVEGVMSVFSGNFEQQNLNSIIYINDEIVFVSDSLSKEVNNTLLYAEMVNMVTSYTGFKVGNLIMELRNDNSANDISGLRGGRLRFRSLYKQLLFT